MKNKIKLFIISLFAMSMLSNSACVFCKESNKEKVPEEYINETKPFEGVTLVTDERYYDLTKNSAEEICDKIIALNTLYPNDGDSKKDVDKALKDNGFQNRISSSFSYTPKTMPSSYITKVSFEGCRTGMDYDIVELGEFPYSRVVVQIDNYEMAEAVFDLLCDYMKPDEKCDKRGTVWRVYGEDKYSYSYVEMTTSNGLYNITFELYIEKSEKISKNTIDN